jgi:DNA-binding GntR family transcriptional regulator
MLRAAILTGEYQPGDPLRQTHIARRYRSSATPVREALRILEAQGLVHHELDRGVTVADINGSIRQLYRLREALEGLATEMAVEKMTVERADRLDASVDELETAGRVGDAKGRLSAHTQFHLLLYEGADFTALQEMITVVRARFPWDELLSVPGIPSARDHRRIVEIARKRDAVGAAEALRQHLQSVPGYLADSISHNDPAAIGPADGPRPPDAEAASRVERLRTEPAGLPANPACDESEAPAAPEAVVDGDSRVAAFQRLRKR